MRYFLQAAFALAIAGVLAACAVNPDRTPLEASLDSISTQRLLAWLIERSSISGWDQEPGTAWIVDQADRIVVVCDYMQSGIPLSSDPRVTRATPSEKAEVWRQHGYNKTVYVTIERIPRYNWSREALPEHVALSLKYSFGNGGAHRYEFALWLLNGDLRAAGFLVGSS